MNADEAMKLLDNGYRVVLFKDGMGSYSAIAVPDGKGLQRAVNEWREYDSPPDMAPADTVFDGPNRSCGCGFTVAAALHALTEKVLFGRLPSPPDPARGEAV